MYHSIQSALMLHQVDSTSWEYDRWFDHGGGNREPNNDCTHAARIPDCRSFGCFLYCTVQRCDGWNAIQIDGWVRVFSRTRAEHFTLSSSRERVAVRGLWRFWLLLLVGKCSLQKLFSHWRALRPSSLSLAVSQIEQLLIGVQQISCLEDIQITNHFVFT